MLRAGLALVFALGGVVASLLASALPRLRVSWLSPTRAADGSPFLDELRSGLHDLGHVEGRDRHVQSYWGENSAERMCRP